jgi:hypothetical protein
MNSYPYQGGNMSDTAYLKQEIEPYVVNYVAKKVGVPLKHRQVVSVGQRTDGTSVHFEFDGVSADEKVGLLVSTTCSTKSGAVRKLFMDASVLLQTSSFDLRIMAFVSNDVMNNFLNTCDGLLPLKRIKMIVCDTLSPAMRNELKVVQMNAKAETGDKGRSPKVSRRRK